MLLSNKDLQTYDHAGVAQIFHQAGYVTTQTPHGLDIERRPLGQAFLDMRTLADKRTDSVSQVLNDVWSERFPVDLDVTPVNLEEARTQARLYLLKKQFLHFADMIAARDRALTVSLLQEAMLPAFFERYPDGKVYIITPNDYLHLNLTALKNLQRASVVPSLTKEVALALARGPTSMEALGLQTPIQILFAPLELAVSGFFPQRYGFVAQNRVTHLFVFLFGHAETVSLPPPDETESVLFPALSIMDARFRGTALGPRRSFPFSVNSATAEEFRDWLERYVILLNDTLAWLNDLTRFPKSNNPNEVDADFAIQAF